MHQNKVILWDWDNTLADTLDIIWRAQNVMRQHYGLSPWSKAEAKQAMNHSGRDLIKNCVGANQVAQAQQYFWQAYATFVEQLKLKEAAQETLNYAKSLGFYNILASNKVQNVLCQEARRLNILSSFDRVIGAEQTAKDKPSKVFTDKALEGLSPQLIIAVGDGLSDVKMGHNYPNGVSVLVFTDAKTSEFNTEKPDYTAKDLHACQKILKMLAEKSI